MFRAALLVLSVSLLAHPVVGKSGRSDLLHRTLQQAAADARTPAVPDVGEDPALGLVERLIDDHDFLGVMQDMVSGNEGLRRLWSTHAYDIIHRAPYLRAIRGLDLLAAKDPTHVRPEDGLAALETLGTFVSAVTTSLQRLTTPDSFLQMAQHYTGDPTLQGLLNAAGEGDASAMLQLQQAIIDREIGDVVDLRALGFDGSEPAPLAMLREFMHGLEFDMFSVAHGGDESIEAWVRDPYRAAMESLDAAGVVLPGK